MMSERELERGPQGDHGQHGDPGPRGPKGEPGERGRDAGRLWPALRLAAFILVAMAAIWSTARTYELGESNKAALAASETSRAESRNQICLSDEREHLNQVEGLKLTYRYLSDLTPEDAREPINRLLIRELERSETEAKTDVAPAFCDETRNGKDVGLPEPDPVIPERPEAVDKLYKAELARIESSK